MAASSDTVRTSIQEELSRKLLLDPDRLIPFLVELSKHLAGIMKDPDEKKRVKNFAGDRSIYLDQLTAGFSQAIREEASRIEHHPSLALAEGQSEEKRLVTTLDSILYAQGLFLFAAKASQKNALQAYGACQEFSALAATYLFLHVGIGEQRCLDIEVLTITMKNGESANHQLLVINRSPGSTLDNMADWGQQCIIFDPQRQWASTIDKIPLDSSLLTHRIRGIDSPFALSIFITNVFSPVLNEFKRHPVLGKLTHISEQALIRNFMIELPGLLSGLGLNQVHFPTLHEWTIKANLVKDLEQLSGLPFATFRDDDYALQCCTELKTATDEERAGSLRQTCGTGEIMTTRDNRRLLFFRDINCEAPGKDFQYKARTTPYGG